MHAVGAPPGDHEEPCLGRCFATKGWKSPPCRHEGFLSGIICIVETDEVSTKASDGGMGSANEFGERRRITVSCPQQKVGQLVHWRDGSASATRVAR